ncbi:hypothetical protein GQ54DRAFT_114943 [Martensiomyces pterosporus]|nr:hypothetical protein GQ54DRAFT_114943 [Martensiomyces pterosporus]
MALFFSSSLPCALIGGIHVVLRLYLSSSSRLLDSCSFAIFLAPILITIIFAAMRGIYFVILAFLCILLTVQASPGLTKRKGGGGSKGPGSSSGSSGSSGSKGPGSSSGSSGSKGPGSSSGSSGSKGVGGGGGSASKGVGPYGDKPPSYASLYPDRSGFNAGGRPSGAGDSTRPYGPPPAYSANAQYATVNRGQTVPPYTFASNSPATYYASTSRTSYPGAWGYGYYPLYPYPWWAYGGGIWLGAVYYQHATNHGVHSYKSEFRNMTVVNATNTPLIGDQDIFNNHVNITFTDFNNGTIQIAPCGNSTSTDLNVDASDCNPIVLDVQNGTVVRGNARTQVQKDITFFDLHLGNSTTTLRTQTISSTQKKSRGGVIAGIVVGCVAFVAIVAGVAFWYFRRRKRQLANAAQ